MTFPPGFVSGCERAVRLMAGSRQNWWIIGSAAVALHLGRAIDVADIDILAHPDDAKAVLGAGGQIVDPAPSALFRSKVFGRVDDDPVIEVMAGLDVNRGGRWRAVRPRTRMSIPVGQAAVPVPARSELHAILLSFGRPKDIARAALLAA